MGRGAPHLMAGKNSVQWISVVLYFPPWAGSVTSG